MNAALNCDTNRPVTQPETFTEKFEPSTYAQCMQQIASRPLVEDASNYQSRYQAETAIYGASEGE